MLQKGNNIYLWGLVSAGNKALCGNDIEERGDYPVIYTRITAYRTWINDHIDQTCCADDNCRGRDGLSTCYTEECAAPLGPDELLRAYNGTSDTRYRRELKKDLEELQCPHIVIDSDCQPGSGQVCQPRKPMYCCGDSYNEGRPATHGGIS